MKSLSELKQIAETYNSGPIVSVALKEAIRWAEAYREVAIGWVISETENKLKTQEDCIKQVDEEAASILEKRKGKK